MGVNKIVFPVYRNIIALVLISPFAYFFEKKDRPPLTFTLLVQFFLLAFIGITANQGFYLLGLYYLSPTYASAIQNTVPAITFTLAAALRLEQVNLNKIYGVAKVFGTIVSIGGATIITLYKGLPLLNHQLPHIKILNSIFLSSNPILNWTLGCVFIIGNCVAWSAWMVLQVPVLRRYPAKLSSLSLTIMFGLIQFLIIASFLENDVERWKVHSTGELFTILYAGLVASGLSLSLHIWCIDKGGPLFTAVFQPVQTVMVAVMAALILGDQLYSGGYAKMSYEEKNKIKINYQILKLHNTTSISIFGRIIGSVLIVIGLYFVLWGKSEEKKDKSNPETKEDLRRHLLSEGTSSKENPNDQNIP
ncbi:WAT1-related protein [Rhynchospora pubera]|uniref:WAT1-related protein n=1 Tax=Rhynchospora pubera TaxID=906938 RepID=A0AAV8EKE6_9POAL|nr:WAT1-related protein [Rhynchospora pubera]